jgi:hypothetical protein
MRPHHEKKLIRTHTQNAIVRDTRIVNRTFGRIATRTLDIKLQRDFEAFWGNVLASLVLSKSWQHMDGPTDHT